MTPIAMIQPRRGFDIQLPEPSSAEPLVEAVGPAADEDEEGAVVLAPVPAAPPPLPALTAAKPFALPNPTMTPNALNSSPTPPYWVPFVAAVPQLIPQPVLPMLCVPTQPTVAAPSALAVSKVVASSPRPAAATEARARAR